MQCPRARTTESRLVIREVNRTPSHNTDYYPSWRKVPISAADLATPGFSARGDQDVDAAIAGTTNNTQGRRHPPQWPVAQFRGGGIRNPRMGGPIACWTSSGTSRPQKRRPTPTQLWKLNPWPCNKRKSAYGKPGAAQSGPRPHRPQDEFPNSRRAEQDQEVAPGLYRDGSHPLKDVGEDRQDGCPEALQRAPR